MSEYRWRTKAAWIGVQSDEGVLLGLLIRSGVVKALGHFCTVEVSVDGKRKRASGAEDRIFPFHSIHLEKGEAPPKKMVARALGWMKNGNDYAYLHPKLGIVKLVGHSSQGERAFDPVSYDDMKPSTQETLNAILYPKEREQSPCAENASSTSISAEVSSQRAP